MATPPSTAEMDGAQCWYYRDDSGTDQGPFPATSMRWWLLHQMLPPTTAVAPSFYGEVPQAYWPIHELWTPPTDAWAAADAQLAENSASRKGTAQLAAAESTGDALWQARVADLAAQHQSEGEGPGPSRSGASKEPRATPYDRPSVGGLQPLGKGKGSRGGGKGGGGKGGGGKGKGGGRGDPDRALPPHLSRIRAMAAAAESNSGARFSAAGNLKNSYSYGS